MKMITGIVVIIFLLNVVLVHFIRVIHLLFEPAFLNKYPSLLIPGKLQFIMYYLLVVVTAGYSIWHMAQRIQTGY